MPIFWCSGMALDSRDFEKFGDFEIYLIVSCLSSETYPLQTIYLALIS